jgi:hypothetical protein
MGEAHYANLHRLHGAVSRHALTHAGGITCANAPMSATKPPKPVGTMVKHSVSACAEGTFCPQHRTPIALDQTKK